MSTAAARAPRYQSEPADHASYMVYRDSMPFLIVNATTDHVERLVADFRRSSDYAWSFTALAA